ncbi:aquaporin family protein [Octadecabacter sp. G9-8]|uniref:Aquaporin family protein n=1 Tax=Octadecabacter dasysiphoniae TaxID=2909341 RepID=A0ABS9CUY4_9RHOB|nr:MIP/aquaporin family protein [Octadecabacter dasysiphoniae]MCF2870624.1 aquaporin family protein [Octadecabacter dasysiphoniae]
MNMQKLGAEFIGTAFLLIGVVGSGIMAQTLTDDTALALLANAIATGCTLYFIITILGPVSGAHFNPVVTLAFAIKGDHPWPLAVAYIPVQIIGAILGVWLCHVMFDLSVLQFSTTDRTGAHQWTSEIFATFGLLFVIMGGLRSNAAAVPTLVALYITGAYWFTSSTSFANPAVTIARMFSDTFAGINPAHVSGFILAQLVGLFVALAVLPLLFGPAKDGAD